MLDHDSFLVVKDAESGLIFSVIVDRGGKLTVVGNMTQGSEWASWAEKSGLGKNDLLATLDGSLYFGPELLFVKEEFATIEPLLTTRTAEKLHGMLPAVVIKTEQESLSEMGSEPDPSDDEQEYEPIVAFSAIDVALSLFDAQLKALVVDYKAMRFLTNKKVASLSLAVKATKSVWKDNGFGGSWQPLSKRASRHTSGFSHLGGVGGKSLLRRTAMSMEHKALKPFDPRTARDADKDFIVGEGRMDVNMGRGVPDPTPFGSRRMFRRRGGATEVAGDMASGKRTSRLAQRLSATAARISAPDKKPTRRAQETPSARRMGRRLAEGPEPTIMDVPSSEPVVEAARESTRSSRGRRPLVSRIIPRAGRRAADAVGSQAGTSRATTGRAPRRDGDSMRARAAERLRRISEKLSGKPTPVVQPKKEPAEPKKQRPSVAAPKSARMRQVAISRTKPMRLLFGVTSPSYGPGKPLEDKDFSAYKAYEQKKILESARQTLATYLDSWKSRLGIPGNEEVTEDAVLAYLDDQAKLGKNIFPLQVQAHNMMLLDDLVHDADINPERNRDISWWNLKQNLRSELLKSTGMKLTSPAERERADREVVVVPPPRPTPRKEPVPAPKPEPQAQKPAQVADRLIPMDPARRRAILEAAKGFGAYDRTIASDRFAYPQIPFSQYSPEEQRRIYSAMEDVRNEVFDAIEKFLRFGTVTGEGREARALLGADEKLDGESLSRMIESEGGSIMPFSGQLGNFGTDFYDLMRSAIAMDDMLADRASNPARNRDEEFLSIDDRVRGQVQRVAEIERRDLVARRTVGTTGERTVFARPRRATEVAEPTQVAETPAETPQIQTETAETVTEIAETEIQETPSTTSVATPVTQQKRTGQIISASSTDRSQLVKQIKTTDADGNEIFVDVSSLGDNGQFEYDNQYVDENDNLFLMERGTQLFRNPLTNDYLESYSEDGREVPVSIDSDIEHMPALPKVRLAKSQGQIISYPQIQLDGRGTTGSKYPSLSELRARSKPSLRNASTKMSIISEALGIDENELLRRSGGQNKKFYFAPNVTDAGLSTENWRQALEIMLQLDDADLSGDFKQNFTTIDIVDAPIAQVGEDGTLRLPTAAETYATYVGRSLDPAENMTLGETIAGIRLTEGKAWREYGKEGRKFVFPDNIPDESIPKHMNPMTARRWHIFEWSSSDNEPNNRNEVTDGLIVPGITKHGDVPLTFPKLIVAWHHPGKEKDRSWSSANWRADADAMYGLATATNKAIVSGKADDWYRAYTMAVNIYRDAVRQADTALAQWRRLQGVRSRGKQPRRNFVMYSERAEMVERLLADVFAPNVKLIERKIRAQKERNARSYNAIAKARRVLSTGDFRNVGGLEERLLGPQLDDNNKVIQRGAEALLEMAKQHHATGFMPTIDMGVKPGDPIVYQLLSDAQIDYLSLARLSHQTFVDPMNPMPELAQILERLSESSTRLQDSARLVDGARKRMFVMAMLRYSGYLDKPIRVSESELTDLMSEYPLRAQSEIPGIKEGAEALKGMHFSPINRGIASAVSYRNHQGYPEEFLTWWFGAEKSASEAASELISGEYWVPAGFGGEAGGSGLNFFHAGANTYSYTAGESGGDKVIAIIPTSARILNRSALQLLNRHVTAIADMINILVARDGDQERDVPIGLDDFDPDPSLPATYEGHFVPWAGVPATIDNNMLDRFADANDDSDFDSKREWLRNLWKSVFGENPPGTIDSKDQKSLERLRDRIIAGLQNLSERTGSPSRRQRSYSLELRQPEAWDYDHLNDIIFEQGKRSGEDFDNLLEDKEVLSGTEWFKRTRAQVIGWYIQLEIAKGQAIAKARAAGESPYNEEVKRIIRAQEALTIPNDEQMAAVIYGVDGYWADNELTTFQNVLDNLQPGISPLTFSTNTAALNAQANAGRQGQFLMVNRTAFIFLDRTLTPNDVTSVIQDMKLSGTNRNPYAR